MRSDSPDTLVWLPVSNAAGETIPAFAAMRVTGVDSDGIFTVAKPNADSAVTNIMFNGPVEIESGLYGHGTFGIPCSARYDTADGTPSNGDEWGVESGGWKLRNAKLGFKIQGSTDSSNGVATVVRNLDAAAAGGGLDLSGRSGSIADVTALQILRGVISGTAGAAVFTPDDASASLPGVVNLSAQTMGDGLKTFLDTSLYSGDVYGRIAVGVTSIGGLSQGSYPNRSTYGAIGTSHHSGGGATQEITFSYDEATAIGGITLTAYGAGPSGYITAHLQAGAVSTQAFVVGGNSGADGVYGVHVGNPGATYYGASGTSGGGDTVKGGIITTLGTAPVPTAIDGGSWV